MSDLAELILRFLVFLNPLGALLVWNRLAGGMGRPVRWIGGLLAAVLALVLLGLAAGFAEDILDALEVSQPSFAIAAGTLLALGTARTFVRLDPFSPIPEGGPYPSAILALIWMMLWLANPGALAAAVYYSADRGRDELLPALAVVLAIAAVLLLAAGFLESILRRVPIRELARLVAAVLIVLAIQLIVDGVMNV